MLPVLWRDSAPLGAAVVTHRVEVCEVCGTDIARDRSRCTNRRCGQCHTKHCTPGGETSPGHGRGSVPTPPSEMTNYQAAVAEAVGALTNILCRLEALKEANDKEVAWQKTQDDFYRVYGPLLDRLAKSSDEE